VRGEEATQAGLGPVDARHHRARTHVHELGDVVDGQVAGVAQGEHDLLVRLEAGQGSVELVTDFGPGQRIVAGLVQVELLGAPSGVPAETVSAGVDDDAAEPGLEPGRVAQAGSLAPSGLEGVVNGILGIA
jgi:hypothetical protein